MLNHIIKDFIQTRQSRAIGVGFFAIGFLFGNWATFIPYVKDKFQLNDADLGLVLLSMPVGTILMNMGGAWLVNKIGMKNTAILGIIGMALAFCIPLNAPSIWLLSIGLFLSGSGISVTNIAINMGVSSIEHSLKVNIMSTCHGMFSVGLMISSILASTVRGMGIVPGYYMLAMAALIIILALIVKPTIFKIQEEKHSSGSTKFVWPRGMFLLMILIALCGNITEGAMADWSSVYMRDIVQTSPYFVGWGLAGYSLFMALGRLFGDMIIPKYGAQNVLFYGGLIVMVGLGLVLLFPYTWTSIIGFAIVGAGVSCGAPILYSSASRVPDLSKGTGLAVLNTFAMGGFMAGPVLIGFISEEYSLKVAFVIVLFLALTWSVLTKKVKLF